MAATNLTLGSSATPMIQIEDLRKTYGQFEAVKGISFNVMQGEVLGFLGPNGAGKSTTMKIMTGLIPPTSGSVRMAGFDVLDDPMGVKRSIGYLPEVPPLYPEMVVRDYLLFAAELRGVPRSKRRAAVDLAAERCGLEQVFRRLCGNLSKGNKQRVGLAQAVIHEPRILILDEPTVGLDPTQVFKIRDIVKEIGRDRTVVLCSHILPEVQATCQKVVIINRGLIVAQGDLARLLRAGSGTRVLLKTLAPLDPAEMSQFPHLVHAEPLDRLQWRVDLDGDAAAQSEFARAVANSRGGLLELTPESTSLEQVFREVVTKEAVA